MTRSEPTPQDFLDRIVARAQGAESVIAPRLPSMFEPLSPAGVTALEQTRQERPATVVHEAEHVATDPLPSIPEQPISDVAADRGAPETFAPPDEVAPMDQQHATVLDGELAPVASLLPAMAQAIDGLTATERKPHTTESERASSPTPVSAVARQSSDDRESATHVRPMSILVETKVIRASDSVATDPEYAAYQPAEPEHERATNETGTLIPALRPALTVRSALAASSKSAAGVADSVPAGEPEARAPTVNVTIGRVEVRAVQGPAARPRAQTPKQKPLSLDDYLKQRGGRR